MVVHFLSILSSNLNSCWVSWFFASLWVSIEIKLVLFFFFEFFLDEWPSKSRNWYFNYLHTYLINVMLSYINHMKNVLELFTQKSKIVNMNISAFNQMFLYIPQWKTSRLTFSWPVTLRMASLYMSISQCLRTVLKTWHSNFD